MSTVNIRSDSGIDPNRDYIIMQRHCTLVFVHTVTVRLCMDEQAISCMNAYKVLLSALTGSDAPYLIQRDTDFLALI